MRETNTRSQALDLLFIRSVNFLMIVTSFILLSRLRSPSSRHGLRWYRCDCCVVIEVCSGARSVPMDQTMLFRYPSCTHALTRPACQLRICSNMYRFFFRQDRLAIKYDFARSTLSQSLRGNGVGCICLEVTQSTRFEMTGQHGTSDGMTD